MNVPVLSRLEDLPACANPVLTVTPWGAPLLISDWTVTTPGAFLIPASLLPEVRRLLDLRPVFLSPEEGEDPAPAPDSRFAFEKWGGVAWYHPTAYGRDLFGRSVVPALPPFRRTVRSGKGGKK